MRCLRVKAFVILFFLFLGCKKDPEKIIRINPAEFSSEDQIKIGTFLKEAIERNKSKFNILPQNSYSQAYQYLNILFQTVINTPNVEHRRDFNWTVNIIHDDTLQTAFFLPGGHFYIYSGLLKYLNSESQLLGVIGHELYYVDTDLLIKQMGKEFGGTTLGDILLNNEVNNVNTIVGTMPYLQFKDTGVMNADSFSVNLICPFQYEPFGIKQVLEKANQGNLSMQWVISRNAEYDNRVLNINTHAVNCGLPGIRNESAYKKFKEEFLP